VDGAEIQTIVQFPSPQRAYQIHYDPVTAKLYYYLSGTPSSFQRANLDGSDPENIPTPSVGTFTLNVESRKLYWIAGSSRDVLYRSKLNGTGVESHTYPSGSLFTLEALGDDLFFGAGSAMLKGIWRADADGSNEQFLHGSAQPLDMAHDPVENKLYWAAYAPGVYRMNPDGTGFEQVVFLNLTSDYLQVVVDSRARKLYWADGRARVIQRSNLDGSNVEDFVTASDVGNPDFLSLGLTIVYSSTPTCSPDECHPPGNIVWDANDLSTDRATRSLRFRLEGKPNGSLEDAIRVELVELGHPNPRNAVATVALPTQTVPQNFSKFDTDSNGICSGATSSPNYNGHPCSTDADCLCNTPSCASNDAAHNGVCIGNSNPDPPHQPLVACTATNETVPADASGQGGCARWVGRPATFREGQEQPTWGHYRAAKLQCTPFYYDWVTETAGKVCAGPLGATNTGLPCLDNSNCTAPATCIPKNITVVGAEILPSSTYSVETYGASCAGNDPALCTNLGIPVTMFTRRHGDVAPVFTPPDVGQPGSTDVAEILRALNKQGPLRKVGAKIYPNLPEENIDLDVGDLGRVLQAAEGYAYPPSEPGPCPCPPVHPLTGLPLLCGVTSCACDAAAGPCAACGGGQCIKTCSLGENDGLACRDNIFSHNHCPGGTCGDGFCRDRCGRCTP